MTIKRMMTVWLVYDEMTMPATDHLKFCHWSRSHGHSYKFSHNMIVLSHSYYQQQKRTMNKYIASIITLAAHSACLEIVDFVVPSVVEVGSENVVLDCNYNFEEAEASELEVKWYFNEDPSPFLVWIAGRKDSQPQIIGSLFDGKIDLEYKVTEDAHTSHRAIMLHKPTIAMAGTYHCKVETLTSEATAEANMLVYSPIMETQFTQKRLPGSRVNISCRIAGVFPLPVTKLTWGVFELFEDHTHVNHMEDSYEVVIHKVLEHEELPAETVFGCEASIPGTEYYVREEAIYHHRGRRETEMNIIKKMEERRKAKEVVFYSSNSINRLDTDEVEMKESFQIYSASSSSSLKASLIAFCFLSILSVLV